MNRIRAVFAVAGAMLAAFGLLSSVRAGEGDYYIFAPVVHHNEEPTETPTPTTPPPTPTQTPTATSPPATTGDVNIVDIFFDGSGAQEPDEYVEIENVDNKAIQLQNWTLRDLANHVFTFPSFVMQPGQVCRVYTNQNKPAWCGFNYGSGSAIWNNTGDCATLKNAGSQDIDEYCYP